MLMTAWHWAACPFVWPLDPYKPTHDRHPMCVWVRQAPENYTWAVEYGLLLCGEYTRRYGKTHACEAVLTALGAMGFPPRLRVLRPLTTTPRLATADLPGAVREFPVCVPDGVFDAVASYDELGRLRGVATYREYYAHKQHHVRMRWHRTEGVFDPVAGAVRVVPTGCRTPLAAEGAEGSKKRPRACEPGRAA